MAINRMNPRKLERRRDALHELASTGLSFAPSRVAEAITALERLEAGEYGTCMDCGRRIPEARLEVKPEAVRCVHCQERHDLFAAA